jgi:FkbH-like protein
LSSEDLLKTEQYKENFFRNESKKAFEDLDSYLMNLDIQVDIIQANENNIMRIAQMTQKTNQFNLTTKRYTEVDLRNLLSEGSKIFCANVKDKFGDNGLICVIILKKEDQNTLFIDTWLMSCRVLKRGVENFVLNTIVNFAIENGFTTIKGEYIPTMKNDMVKDHYINLGFEGNETYFSLETPSYQDKKNYINIKK